MYSDVDIIAGHFNVDVDPPFLVLFGKEEADIILDARLRSDLGWDSDSRLVEADLRFYRTRRFFDTFMGFYTVSLYQSTIGTRMLELEFFNREI